MKYSIKLFLFITCFQSSNCEYGFEVDNKGTSDNILLKNNQTIFEMVLANEIRNIYMYSQMNLTQIGF